MKSVQDFFNAIAAVFSFSTESATPAEVHTAFLDAQTKATEELAAANTKLNELQAEVDTLKSGKTAIQTQLDASTATVSERDATIVELNAKIDKLAKVAVPGTGSTADQIVLKGDKKEYTEKDAPRW